MRLATLAVLLLGAAQAGVSLGMHSTSGPSRYHKLIDCFVTDDVDMRNYSGSLLPGQSFSASWTFCYHDDYVVDGVDEGVHEDLGIAMVGKGALAVSLVVENRERVVDIPFAITPGRQTEWRTCTTYHDRIGTIPYDSEGHVEAGGTATLTVTNVGSKVARDLSIATLVSVDSASFVNQWC